MSSVASGSSADLVLRTEYIDAYIGSTTLCSTSNTENYPSITMTMKAQTSLSRIVLVPPICIGVGSYPSVCAGAEQSLDVYLDNYDGTSTLCGSSLLSIYTNFEFTCGVASGY